MPRTSSSSTANIGINITTMSCISIISTTNMISITKYHLADQCQCRHHVKHQGTTIQLTLVPALIIQTLLCQGIGVEGIRLSALHATGEWLSDADNLGHHLAPQCAGGFRTRGCSAQASLVHVYQPLRPWEMLETLLSGLFVRK